MKKNLLKSLLVIACLLCSASVFSCNSKSNNSSNSDDAMSVSVDAANPAADTDVVKKRISEFLSDNYKLSKEETVKKYFSKEFGEVYTKVNKYFKIYEEPNKYWGEDGDYFGRQQLDGFDEYDLGYGDFVRIDINVQLIADLKALANVIRVFEEGKETVKYQLIYENENWYIDEVIAENNFSYKKEMKKHLKRMGYEGGQNPFDGKMYKGSEYYYGIPSEMMISFYANNKCRCVSDWAQNYSTPKAIEGSYEVKNDKVIVHCNDNNFVFNVTEQGRVLSFNESEGSVEEVGQMGQYYMYLEYFGGAEKQ